MAVDPAAGIRGLASVSRRRLDQWLRFGNKRPTDDSGSHTYLAIGFIALFLIVIVVLMALFPWTARKESAAGLIESQPAGIASIPPNSARPAGRSSEPAAHVEPGHSRMTSPPHESKVRLIGNRETRLYHRAECRSVQSMAERNRYALESANQADAEGFRSCDKCRPPVFKPPASASSQSPPGKSE